MQTFTCSPARADDAERILYIISSARARLAAHGIPQWQGEYPSAAFVAEKTAAGRMYAVRRGGEVAAVFTVEDYEPDYAAIRGTWLTAGNYLAVHAVAVAPEFLGSGCAKFIFRNAFDMARERGRGSVRIDTHELNAPMRGLLRSLGFEYCGMVTLSSGDGDRMAFERTL